MKISHIKFAFLPAALLICLSFTAPDTLAKTEPIQGSANRNSGQNQQGLTPEKKKSLSKYGPEDVFPDASQQEEAARKEQRALSRKVPSSPTPALDSATTATKKSGQSTETVSPSPRSGSSPAVDQQQASVADHQATTDLVLPTLAILSLLVLTALIYVLLKLMDKLREPGI